MRITGVNRKVTAHVEKHKLMGDTKVLRFLKLLSDRGFVQESLVSVNGKQKKLFRFGPQGTLLRKNIIKQWWDAVVAQQANTFCLESPPVTIRANQLNVNTGTESAVRPVLASSSSSPNSVEGVTVRTSLTEECLAAYLPSLQMASGQLPISLASTGQCFNLDRSLENNSNLLSNGLCETHLLSQHYIPPVNVTQTVDFWTRRRISWWKQFSTNPSKISSSTSASNGNKNSNKNGINRTVITYSFPWGTEPLETISNHGSEPLLQLESKSGQSSQGRYHKLVFHPHLLECQTSVERCMAAFLTDAYRERLKKTLSERNQDVMLVLQLHLLLCPYHAALSVTGSNTKDVQVLSQHVARELRQASISVLNLPRDSDSMETQYRRNDELGVPYTVVLSDQTLETGVISIRNRDTGLKQQHHIKELQSIILGNLHAKDLVK